MDSPKTGLTALGEHIQQALEAETQPAEQLRRARTQLLDRVTGTPRRAPRAGFGSRTGPRAWLFGASMRRLRYATLAAGAALALAVALAHSWSQPISFVAGSARGGVGDVLEAGRDRPLRIEFSEGSHMLLQQGARARVLDTQTAGARVLLESGAADISISHRAGRAARWRFEAGPFQVLVTGTQFELDWQPAAQSLSLTMRAGSVELSAPCLAAPRRVARGESLQLSCATPEPRAPAARAQPAPGATASAPQAPNAVSQTPAAAPKTPRSFAASWESADKSELVAWANRERLAGSVTRARAALLALRRRFAGSTEAGTAAFTLGRMAFDQRHDYGEAARWFATYLAEQPNGPLLGDAAGRLLEAHERQGSHAAARRAAQAYLGRFPDGPYASLAKRILAE